jgi:Flp pilus assembly protein TadG
MSRAANRGTKERKWLRNSGLICFTGLRDDSASSLVEMAIMLPVFILLAMGAAEFGTLAFYSIEVSNAARAGLAYGAQSPATAANTSGIQTAAQDDAPDVTRIATLAVTPTVACSCTSGTTITCTNAAANCTSPDRIIQTLHVATSATMTPFFHAEGMPASYTLTGSAYMRVQQ